MKLTTTALAGFLLLSCVNPDPLAATQGGSSSTAEISRKPAAKFTLIDADRGLYSIEDAPDYVLQIIFYSANQVSQIRILPRYFFHDIRAEWTAPDYMVAMPTPSYERILAGVQSVKSFGRLIQQGKVGVTLNLRSSFADQYVGAVVERALFRGSPDDEYKVAWFCVQYFHPISGTLEAKHLDKLDQTFRIRVDGRWYWANRETYHRLKVGARAALEGAGPINN